MARQHCGRGQSAARRGSSQAVMMKRRALALAAGGVIVAGALLGLFLLLTAGSAAAKEFATLRVIEGTVQYEPAGGSSFSTASDRQALRERDTGRTGPDRRAD